MLQQALLRLTNALETGYGEVAEGLNGPATVQSIGLLRERVPHLTPDFAAMFEWHDGEKATALGLYPPHRLYSVAECVTEWEYEAARWESDLVEQPIWSKSLFPFMCFEGEWVCTLAASGIKGSPVFYRASEDPEIELLAPSLPQFIEFLAACYENRLCKVWESDYGAMSEFDETRPEKLRREMFGLGKELVDGQTSFDIEKEYDFVQLFGTYT